jgi:uncharacterized protein
MNLPAVFLTGLLAGGVSCAAVQGGLLAGLVSRQKATASRTGAARDNAAKGPVTAARGKSSTATVVTTTTWRTRLGDDLAPVGGFLAGKLVSYTLAGAVLGALGTLIALSPHTRAVVQVLAGLLIIAFGLAQLEVAGPARAAPSPQPSSASRPSSSPAASPCR